MRRAGVQPNTVSYNSLLSVCERCGQAERALEVFTTMEREAGPTIGYTGSSVVTYNTLISACGKAGMYDQVQRIHAEMLAKGLRGDVFTMCGLITACERVRAHAVQGLLCCILHLPCGQEHMSCSEVSTDLETFSQTIVSLSQCLRDFFNVS